MTRFFTLVSSLLLGSSLVVIGCGSSNATGSGGGGAASSSSGSGGATVTGTGGASATSGSTSSTASGTGGSGTGGSGGGGGSTGFTPRTKARFFLSGHSLTDNPLADNVLSIAASLGNDANYNEQIGIGSPMRVRTKGDSFQDPGWPGYSRGKNREGQNMNVIQELLSPATLGPGERYDTLVITERHDILSTIAWEDTVGFLRHYHDRLIAGNSAASTLFYHSWLDIDKANPTPWITHEKGALAAWECVAAKVNLTLAAENRADRVTTLPAGAALVKLVEEILAGHVAGITGTQTERLNRIFNDNVHMTALGSYYVSLVTYAALFHSSPEGAAAPPGIDTAPVADMQKIAWEFVKAYYTQPAPGEHTMAECRAFMVDGVCASFWNLLGQPGQVAGCQSTFSNVDADQNPFRWPDAKLKLWPDP